MTTTEARQKASLMIMHINVYTRTPIRKIAEKVGCSQSTLYKIYQGIQTPRYDTLSRIEELYKKEVEPYVSTSKFNT